MFTRTASTSSQQVSAPRPAREAVELILSQLDRLPTLPAVAVRLLALTTSGTTSARDVVQVLESDASLTAAILRLVRRADLGVRGEVATVERAVTLLGQGHFRLRSRRESSSIATMTMSFASSGGRENI